MKAPWPGVMPPQSFGSEPNQPKKFFARNFRNLWARAKIFFPIDSSWQDESNGLYIHAKSFQKKIFQEKTIFSHQKILAFLAITQEPTGHARIGNLFQIFIIFKTTIKSFSLLAYSLFLQNFFKIGQFDVFSWDFGFFSNSKSFAAN